MAEREAPSPAYSQAHSPPHPSPHPSQVLTPGDLARLRAPREAARFATPRTVGALILREMSSAYGRSPGGYLWVILEPLLGIGLLVAIFSAGFRAPPLGSDFGLFYATGLLPLSMFVTTSLKVSQAINYSRQLLSYPRVTFLDAVLARFVLNVITQCIVSGIVIGAIVVLFETRSTFVLPHILQAYALAAGLGLGVGLLLCTLISQHPLWNTVWGVITRPLFLVSGVVLLHEDLPDPYARWLDWNPLVHVTGLMRQGFYYSYRAEYLDLSYGWIVALSCALSGLFFLRRYHRGMMEK